MSFPWGKFRGVQLSAVPASYLGWAIESANLHPELRGCILLEFVRRFDLPSGVEPPRTRPDPATAATAAELVRHGYKALALRAHPDVRGGSHEAMLSATAARDWLAGGIPQ